MKFANKNNVLFLFILSFNLLFYIRNFSYFAQPKLILYDEWFDDNFEKNKLEKNSDKYTQLSIKKLCLFGKLKK